MRYTVDHIDNQATLILHESHLNAENSSELKGELIVLCRSGIDVLFVDLGEVIYCDSSGLSAMLMAHREMGAAGGYAIYYSLSPEISSLIELARLDRVLFIYPTKEEALADLDRQDDDEDDDLDLDIGL
ncbi:MAG: STAS domain-containing protein [Candidatus Kapaibacterium sp.]